MLYLQETGTTGLISVYDINQGQIGDCFLLSSIGEIALWHPSAIMNMIQANANGTETVTLYLAANGSLPTYGTTSFEQVSITVTNTFPSDGVEQRRHPGRAERARRRSGSRSWKRRWRRWAAATTRSPMAATR